MSKRPATRPALLTVRSAVVFLIAILTAIAAAVLLYAAHRSVPLAVLGSAMAFATALGLADKLIELPALGCRADDT
jgi:hypothetical protein